MKAQKYYEKYFENCTSREELNDGVTKLYYDILDEYQVLQKSRGAKTLAASVGIVRELNDKWNAVASLVENKFKSKVLKRNVIWNIVLSEAWPDRFPKKPD